MKLKAFALSLLICGAASVYAESAVEVVTKYKNLAVPPYSTGTLYLDSVSPSGQVTEHRELKQYGKIFRTSEINVVFEFTTPKSIKDTRILQSEKIGKTDDNFVYTPDLRQVRRLPVAERNKSVVGTELTYGDMRIRDVEDDRHEMMDENATITVESTTYKAYKIRSTPVKKSEVDHSMRITWFDKETYLPVRVEYYDKKDKTKLTRSISIEKIEHVKGTTGNDYVLRRLCWAKNEINGRRTRVYVKDFLFDAQNVTDSYFTQNWLKTGRAK
ncbi:MAG: outer membrane lipoprotein-sorting protein [Treponema sp.]|nr:outer membrane lipoprotein-sorting protein [Candidatus Treponema equifaecale]